jgi:hypothetical protein
VNIISISSCVCVKGRADHAAQFNFTLVSFSLAANNFVYIDFDLTLVSQLAKFLAQEPVLGLCFGTIEVLGCTSQN